MSAPFSEGVCLCLLPYEYECVCVCVSRVSEPTPWVSAVGLSRDEQSRIKSILILARQEPLLLLGDTSTEREEKREQTLLLLLLLLLSSLLSHSFAPSSSPRFFIPSRRLRLSFSPLLLFFFLLAALSFAVPPPHPTPSNPPPLLHLLPSTSRQLLLLILSLLSPLVSAPQRDVAGTVAQQTAPLWSSRRLGDFHWVPEGSLWKPGRELAIYEERESAQLHSLRDDDSLLNVKNVMYRQSANQKWYQITK